MSKEAVAEKPESTVPDIFESGGEKEYAEAVLGKDSEYQEMRRAENESGKSKKPETKGESSDKKEDPAELPPGKDGKTGNEEEASATEGEEEKEKGEDKKEGEEGDDVPAEETEFEDNILPGLTGKQFESMDEETREVVTKVHDELDSATKKATETQTQLDRLLNDPIVRHRKELIEKGQNAEEYALPDVNDRVLDNVQQLIDADTPESKQKLKELIVGIQKQAAEIGSQNRGIQEQAQFETKAMLKKAGDNLKALGKLAKNLNVDMDADTIVKTDITKLGDLGKILMELGDRAKKGHIGSVTRYLAETDPKEVYAQMAIKHNWPLIANADKEVRKIVRENNEKLYSRFFKKKPDEASGTFPRGSEVDSRSVAKGVLRDGINIVKLATDDSYHDTILYSKSEEGWPNKVGKLREEGERLIEKNPRLAAPPKSKT